MTVSALLDEEEFSRWMRSAKLTLESARLDLDHGFFNWCCFKCHQAAEKALKAILYGAGRPKVGHSLVRLVEHVRELGIEVPQDVTLACYKLTRHYIPTRYPNAWSEGIPEEYYTRQDAEEAIEAALRVIRWAEETWRELSRLGSRRGGERSSAQESSSSAQGG